MEIYVHIFLRHQCGAKPKVKNFISIEFGKSTERYALIKFRKKAQKENKNHEIILFIDLVMF